MLLINTYLKVLEHCKAHGLSPRTVLLLMSLDEKGGQQVTDLAGHIGMSQQSVGKRITGLGFAGLVKQSVAKEDRRARSVSITAKGRELVAQLEASW